MIKSCKTTNLEFLKLKEKLGLCIYEEICDETEFILTSKIFFLEHDVGNEKSKKENKKIETRNEKVGTRNEKLEMRNEKVEARYEKVQMTNENEHFKKINIIKEEPKSPNWIDKNKFK